MRKNLNKFQSPRFKGIAGFAATGFGSGAGEAGSGGDIIYER